MDKVLFILYSDMKVSLMKFILSVKERRIGRLEVKLSKRKDSYRGYLKQCSDYCKRAYKKINS